MDSFRCCEAAFNLKANNGSGSGGYAPGAMTEVSAAEPPAGQVFERWTDGRGLTGPVTAPDKLIFGSTAGVFMTCLDPGNGQLKWRCYVGEAVPGIYRNQLFFLSRNGYFNTVK